MPLPGRPANSSRDAGCGGRVASVRPPGQLAGVPVMNYARRQQYRRLSRAGGAAAGGATALLLALALASAGAFSLAAVLLLAAVAFGFTTRHWLGLAGRSRVGARSEDEVHRQLAALERDGWRTRHSLRGRGPGDVDSVAIAPSGIAFAIETKTRAYDGRHLLRVREQAEWLSRRRSRWCPRGTLPVLCVVRDRRVERYDHDVLVVSLDCLVPTLRAAAAKTRSSVSVRS